MLCSLSEPGMDTRTVGSTPVESVNAGAWGIPPVEAATVFLRREQMAICLSVGRCAIEGMSEHEALNTANANAARAAGWPELTGSPKQIEWATTVRANKIREMETSTMQGVEPDWYREVMLRETSASAWIDSRNQPWQARFIGSLTHEEMEGLKAKAVQDAAPVD